MKFLLKRLYFESGNRFKRNPVGTAPAPVSVCLGLKLKEINHVKSFNCLAFTVYVILLSNKWMDRRIGSGASVIRFHFYNFGYGYFKIKLSPIRCTYIFCSSRKLCLHTIWTWSSDMILWYDLSQQVQILARTFLFSYLSAYYRISIRNPMKPDFSRQESRGNFKLGYQIVHQP